jgi:hypothetical protein
LKKEIENLSPLSNLFTKHVGNFYEQYKKVEQTLEDLLSQVDSKQQFKSKEATHSNKAIQSLPKDKDKRAKYDTYLSNLENLPDVPDGVQLNTRQVADSVKDILEKEFISKKLFASFLSISVNLLKKLIKSRTTWTECSEYRRKLYFKMHQWAQSHEEIRSLAAREAQTHVTFLSNLKKLPDVPHDVVLDTKRVASTVKHILSVKKISQRKFSRKILSFHVAEFSKLIRNPTPWAECSVHQKKRFYRMHRWSQSPDEIIDLKNLRD